MKHLLRLPNELLGSIFLLANQIILLIHFGSTIQLKQYVENNEEYFINTFKQPHSKSKSYLKSLIYFLVKYEFDWFCLVGNDKTSYDHR